LNIPKVDDFMRPPIDWQHRGTLQLAVDLQEALWWFFLSDRADKLSAAVHGRYFTLQPDKIE